MLWRPSSWFSPPLSEWLVKRPGESLTLCLSGACHEMGKNVADHHAASHDSAGNYVRDVHSEKKNLPLFWLCVDKNVCSLVTANERIKIK